MAAKCPNKKKDAMPVAAANVAEGDGKGVALTVVCLAATLLANDKDLWSLDLGCSQHMTGRKEWFTVIRDPSVTKPVKGFDGSLQEVAGVGEVLLEGTNGLRVTLHDVSFVLGMKASLVSPGQLTDKGANLQTEGVTCIIASGGQVDATARYHHRLLCLDMKPWPASKGTAAAAACNGTVAAAACNGTAAAASCNGTVYTTTCNGMEAAASCNVMAATTASNGTTKVVADVVPNKPEVKEGAAKQDNLPPPRTIIVVPLPSMQGGEQQFDRSVGPVGSKAPMAVPPSGLSSSADSAPVGTEDGPLEDGGDTADHEEEGEVAVDEKP
ncbi:unnamed protein product [Closterium sp. NIES-54]